LRLSVNWKVNGEASIFSSLALNLNGPAVIAHNAKAHTQPQPGAPVISLGSEERIEDMTYILLGNAYPIIEKPDLHSTLTVAIFTNGADLYCSFSLIGAARFERIMGIADQVN